MMMFLRSLSIYVVIVTSSVCISKVTSFSVDYQRLSLSIARQALPNKRGGSLVFYSKPDDDEDDDDDDVTGPQSCNVLGTDLTPCCTNVGGTGIGTGFYRNGFCSTGEQDMGRHTVCVQVTDNFLEFSKSVGNDLSTPAPHYMFPGLNDGDIWCLCAQRWAQAYNAGNAPKLFLKATHEKTLDYIPLKILMKYAIDKDEADTILDELNEQRARLDKLF